MQKINVGYRPSTSAYDRAVPMRMRADLLVQHRKLGGKYCWVIKDPLTLRHFQLQAEEFALLRMLDGRASLNDLKRQFESNFVPERLNLPRVQWLIGSFHRDGLVIANTVGQGGQLAARQRQVRLAESWQRWLNPLAIRFRGVNPQRWLDRLLRAGGWMFSPWFIGLCCLLIFTTILFALMHANDICDRLPELSQWMSASNLLWTAAVLTLVKVLHELGHGLTCRHFGGECHEMGIMLLVFTPCLYCNVSDAWLFSNRWHRAAVAGAGMFVELVIASIATFLWWHTRPGLMNGLCLNAMVVCSLGTLLVNGNPLLRYDGYFVFSDLLDLPNLWQQSRVALRRAVHKLLHGSQAVRAFELPIEHPVFLMLYALASMVYRFFMVVAVLLFILKMSHENQIPTLGRAVVAFILLGMTLPPIRSAWSRPPSTNDNPVVHSRRRLLILSLGVLAGLVLWLPLPFRLSAPAILEANNVGSVYVTQTGILVECLKEGDQVAAGQVLARLESVPLQTALLRVRGEYHQHAAKVQQLEMRQGVDARAAIQLPSAREVLLGLASELKQREQDVQQLDLHAPRSGIVFASPYLPDRMHEHDVLEKWTGSPLLAENHHCTLERGTLLCQIGDAEKQRWTATCYVTQADLPQVQVGQTLRLVPAQCPGSILLGSITEISHSPVADVPSELFLEGYLPYRTGADGRASAVEPLFEVRATMTTVMAGLSHRAMGSVRISLTPQSLGQWLMRRFRETFSQSLQL